MQTIPFKNVLSEKPNQLFFTYLNNQYKYSVNNVLIDKQTIEESKDKVDNNDQMIDIAEVSDTKS